RGIKNNKMRENLLANPKLDLDNVISLCRAAETASRQAQQCTSGSSQAAGGSVTPALEELHARSRATAASWSGRNQRSYGEPRINTSTPQRKCYSAVDVCAKCGRRHKFNEKCWARNGTCYRCNRVGHFTKMCRVQYVNDMEVAKVILHFFITVARRRRKESRPRRQRTTFSAHQTLRLELEYARGNNSIIFCRCELASALSLSETQVKIWFQNRRAKDKRIEKQTICNCFRHLAAASGLFPTVLGSPYCAAPCPCLPV
ncbi:hypothetical protein ACJJTC_009962, partial [Scirpophaga incertulas]